MPNGIDLILADHAVVNALFAEFDEAARGDTIGLVIAALRAHDEAEHAALYPMVALLVGDQDIIDRSAAAHSVIKKQIDLVTSLEGPPLVDAFVALRDLVTAHVADEEGILLPALAEVATPQQLEELGARVFQAKQRGG